MSRRKRITLDYLHGATVKDLAEREGVSPPRIYQFIDETRRKYGVPKDATAEQAGCILARQRDVPGGGVISGNPEQFYWAALVPNRQKERLDFPDETHSPKENSNGTK